MVDYSYASDIAYEIARRIKEKYIDDYYSYRGAQFTTFMQPFDARLEDFRETIIDVIAHDISATGSFRYRSNKTYESNETDSSSFLIEKLANEYLGKTVEYFMENQVLDVYADRKKASVSVLEYSSFGEKIVISKDINNKIQTKDDFSL